MKQTVHKGNPHCLWVGQPEKVDSIYVRNSIADVFMISEPLAGRRETVVTQICTTLDFAEILRLHYIRNFRQRKHADWQNALNVIIHRGMEAGWIWLKLKSISWSRQALRKPYADLESFKQQVRTGTIKRNAECIKINYQFMTQDTRIKLARLYSNII